MAAIPPLNRSTRTLPPPSESSRRASRDMAVVALTLFAVTAAVNLQMPLYRAYAVAAGLGYAVTTIVFAFYVVGLLPTLILFGGISDRVGRRNALLAGLVASLLATLIMIVAPGLRWLWMSRLLQGIGVGLALGAGSAYLVERRPPHVPPTRATTYVAVATSLGFGGGALATGAALLYHTTPRPLSFPAVALLAIVAMACVAGIQQTPAAGGGLLRLPIIRRRAVPANLAILTAWALTGVIVSLLPSQLARHGLSAWAGPALFLVNGTGVLMQPTARRLTPSSALLVGFACLPVGFALLLLGAARGTLALVMVGAAVAGAASYGFTYQGSLAIACDTRPESRAREVAGYFLCGYLGFGLPSVALGGLSDRFGLMASLVAFLIAMTIACLVLAAIVARSRGRRGARRHSSTAT